MKKIRNIAVYSQYGPLWGRKQTGSSQTPAQQICQECPISVVRNHCYVPCPPSLSATDSIIVTSCGARMHIDHDNLDLRSEGDVEAKLLIPLLCGELYLGIPSQNFFAKEYSAPSDIDKGAKVPGGYYPDFSVWVNGFPVLIVEAKTPGTPVEQAYREAQLYARHLNSQPQPV